MISKQKQKIRVIHLVEPEIIKTDAENFRELVQRLTGKPEEGVEEMARKGNAVSSLVSPKKTFQAKEIWQHAHKIEDVYPSGFSGFLGDHSDGFNHVVNGFLQFPLMKPSEINSYDEMSFI